MSRDEILEAALTLSIQERAEIAQALWQTLDLDDAAVPSELVDTIRRRRQELSSGSVQGVSRNAAIESIRKSVT